MLATFTTANNKPCSKFSTLPVKGKKVVFEYFEPQQIEDQLYEDTSTHNGIYGNQQPDYFGRIDIPSNGNASDWLNPSNSESLVLDELDPNSLSEQFVKRNEKF